MKRIILFSVLFSLGYVGTASADSKENRAKLIFSAMGISDPSKVEVDSVIKAMTVKLEYDVSRVIKQKRDSSEFKSLLNARNHAEEDLNAALEASKLLWDRHEKAKSQLREKLESMPSDEKTRATQELTKTFTEQRVKKDEEVRKAQTALDETQLALDSYLSTSAHAK